MSSTANSQEGSLAKDNPTPKRMALPPEGGQQTSAEKFLQSAVSIPIIDVRSPGEYNKGHIPHAHSIPLFKDEERAIVGTIYKQLGQKNAIEKGLEIVAPKMLALAEKAKKIAINGKVLVHCWRGGMRSNRMAWLFEQSGLQCAVLKGGYKAYRNFILSEMGALNNLVILAGPTGSGKTDILHEMKKRGEQIIDLEGLANHRGSVFGAIGMPDQPSSQQFQNDLYKTISNFDLKKPIWVESESLTIGRCYLPQPFWEAMKQSPSVNLVIDREIRVKRLVVDYGSVPKEDLLVSVEKIRQSIGGNRVKESKELLEQNDFSSVASLLLKYYDKSYAFGRKKNCTGSVLEIESHTGDPSENAKLILERWINQKQTERSFST